MAGLVGPALPGFVGGRVRKSYRRTGDWRAFRSFHQARDGGGLRLRSWSSGGGCRRSGVVCAVLRERGLPGENGGKHEHGEERKHSARRPQEFFAELRIHSAFSLKFEAGTESGISLPHRPRASATERKTAPEREASDWRPRSVSQPQMRIIALIAKRTGPSWIAC